MVVVSILTVALLVAGVVLTAIPKAPGGMRWPLAATYLYWWSSGFTAPSTTVVLALTAFGVLVKAADMLGPVITSKIGGTSVVATMLGSLAGGIAFLFWGFQGMILFLFLTVFVVEYWRRGDLIESLLASLVVVLVSLATRTMKTFATIVFLVVMLGVILL